MKKRYIFLIIILVLLLIVVAYLIYNKINLNNLKKMEEECEAKGGVWNHHIGFSGKWVNYCNLPTKDAGKWCNDSEQCESGLCAAPEEIEEDELGLINGTCYGWTVERTGNYVENGAVVRLEVD
ncbi:MAG: hypothetical protein ABIE36_01590 [Candidatus Diapherotrites archaeon]